MMTRAVRDRINFPEYAELINFFLTKKFFRVMWHPAYCSSDNISYPDTLVYERNTVRYGGVKVIMKRFDDNRSYSPHENNNLFSARWWCSKTEKQIHIDTDDKNELMEFIKKYY